MCGISGLVALTSCPKAEMHNTLSNITTHIAHRGPDAQQIWCDNGIPLALGHRRLSIIDLTDDGLQPMHSHDGRYTMVFNGEFYNFQDIKEELSTHNILYKGH
jgi:asparagine synthase (glutamine-hydrolysing)